VRGVPAGGPVKLGRDVDGPGGAIGHSLSAGISPKTIERCDCGGARCRKRIGDSGVRNDECADAKHAKHEKHGWHPRRADDDERRAAAYWLRSMPGPGPPPVNRP